MGKKLSEHEQHDIDIKSGNYNENLSGDYNENVEEKYYEIIANTVNIVENSKVQLFALIIILLGGIVTSIATIFVIPKLSFSEQYKSYENSEYKLEHPKQWIILEEDGFPYYGTIFLSPKENQADKFQEQVKFSVEELDKPLSLTEYTELAIKEIESSNSILEYPTTISLANREGRKVIYQGKDEIKYLQIWALKKKKAYIVTYTAEADKFKKFAKQAENIIYSLQIKD
ncbi:MAG: hypothetical protein AB4372_17140 [Xenococcus sp. (in: cyanobacteria)]